jgi:uncharacterized protein
MKSESERKGKIFESPQFMLIPSRYCPAKCEYCFGPNNGPKMDMQMVERVLDFMHAFILQTGQKSLHVTLHGGEPLSAGYEIIEALLKGLFRYFRMLDYRVSLQSNLWLLDEAYCALLREYSVNVSTSLDGPERINDAQRGHGYYQKTLAGMRLARENGISVGCITTFTPQSMLRWNEIFDFFRDIGLSFNEHPAVPAIGHGVGGSLTPKQYASLFNEMFQRYVRDRKDIRISSYDQICKGVLVGEGEVCTFQDCFGKFLAIDSTGDIYSCQRFAGMQEFCLGSVFNDPAPRSLAQSDAARKLLNREEDVRRACGTCVHYSYCKGGCTYNAFAANDVTDPYCEAYKSMFLDVRKRIYADMVSEENRRAIELFGPGEHGNPLLRRGAVVELAGGDPHPALMAQTARKIVFAYELGKNGTQIAHRLAKTGIFLTEAVAQAHLNSVQNDLQTQDQLNKFYLHVTWNCQLSCTHCYAQADSRGQGEEMAVPGIEKLISQAAMAGFRGIVITGGEPLVHKDHELLLRVLIKLRRQIKPAKLILRTNFSMFLGIDDFVLLSQAFDQIVVSVDGDKTAHDERRGAGMYDKVRHNLKAYSAVCEQADNLPAMVSPARLAISAVMDAAQAHGRAGLAVRELAREFNISHVKFRPMLPLGRAMEEEAATLDSIRADLPPLETMKRGFNPAVSCGIGQNLYVEPSGESFPCYAYHKPHAFLGNVLQDGVSAVLNDEKFKALKTHTVDTNEKCRGCAARYICGGGCRAWGEAVQNDLDTAPVRCEALRDRAEALVKSALAYLECD